MSKRVRIPNELQEKLSQIAGKENVGVQDLVTGLLKGAPRSGAGAGGALGTRFGYDDSFFLHTTRAQPMNNSGGRPSCNGVLGPGILVDEEETTVH